MTQPVQSTLQAMWRGDAAPGSKESAQDAGKVGLE